MDNSELIWEFQEAIVDIYEQENLISLSGFDDNYIVNNRNILTWFVDITGRNPNNFEAQFDYFKNLDDIKFCCDELLYFTAHLYLYRSYINNPVKDGELYYGKMHYPNNQNIESKRYSMFADITCQNAYNFWDRIGDLLASFFPGLLTPFNITFIKVIEAIAKENQQSENYAWLKKFKETDYSELNKKRKNTVHYITSDTEFKYRHLERIIDKESMQALQSERENLADFYKKHLSLTITGFEKTLLFLDEISPLSST